MRRLAKTIIIAVALCPTASLAKEEGLSCSKKAGLHVADMSIPSHKIHSGERYGPILLHDIGINTVIRYYDYKRTNNETIEGKTLLPDELRAIADAKLNVAVIWQHRNSDPIKFIYGNAVVDEYIAKGRDIDVVVGKKQVLPGRADALEALELAALNGQPFGTVIYFGIDGPDDEILGYRDELIASVGHTMTEARIEEVVQRRIKANKNATEAEIRDDVRDFASRYAKFLKYYKDVFPSDLTNDVSDKTKLRKLLPYFRDYYIAGYLRDAKAVFDEAAKAGKYYQLGTYGDGYVLQYLVDNKSDFGIKHFWLSQSKGHLGYNEFYKSKQWALAQEMPTKCYDWPHPIEKNKIVDLDFNQVRPGQSDFGQWAAAQSAVLKKNLP